MTSLDTETRLRGIATFVQAVEAGSFALAAERLRQTRSAVGKSVARLEERLGTRLLNRSTRRLSLTPNGQAFYERCKRALAEIEAAEAALDDGGRELVGRLRVSVPLLLGRQVIAPLLCGLAGRHPRLEVEAAFSDRVSDLLADGLDLAVRLGELRDSATLAARSLGRFEFIVCAAPAYLERHGELRTVEDFARHVAVGYAGPGPESPWWASDAAGRRCELQVQRRLRFDDLQAIADATRAGAGLARLPAWLAAPHLQTGALRRVGSPDAAFTLETHAVAVHAVWPHTRHLPMKTRALIDLLVAEVPARIAAGGIC